MGGGAGKMRAARPILGLVRVGKSTQRLTRAPPFYPVAPEDGELDRISVVITSQLYLTNWRGAADEKRCRALKVSHIVSVGTEFADDPARHEGGITYWQKSIDDDDDAASEMAASLKDVAAFIHGAISGGGVCLVHCAAGISRSATAVLAYLILHTKLTLREAFGAVISARRPVWPNDGFMRALIALEDASRGTASLSIDEYVAWGDFELPPEGAEDAIEAMRPALKPMQTFVDEDERQSVLLLSAASAAGADAATRAPPVAAIGEQEADGGGGSAEAHAPAPPRRRVRRVSMSRSDRAALSQMENAQCRAAAASTKPKRLD